MSLDKIALGAAFLSLANILRILSQVLVLPIMALLLGPADYGLVAIVMPFIVFSMLISDCGLGSSLVRTGDKDGDVWATGFWLASAAGAALALLLVALSPVVAWLYADLRLQPLMMALAAVVVLQSLVAVPGAALQKQARFMALGLSETAAVAAGLGAMLAVAFSGGGAWALVTQQLVFWAVRLVLTAALSPFRPRPVFTLERTWPHVIFGRDTMAATMVGFFSRNLDALVIGIVLGAGDTGLYALAMQLARMPLSIVSGPLYTVAYSHIAQRREDRAEVRAVFLALVRLVAIAVLPAMGLLAACHDLVFGMMLSSKWTASSTVFMMLAPVCGLQAIGNLGGSVLVAYGRTLTQLRLNAEFAGLWLIALAASVPFGIQWVALSYCAAVIVYFPRSTAVTLAVIECPASAYLPALLIPAGAAAAAAAAARMVIDATAPSTAAELALMAALWAAAAAASALAQAPAMAAELRAVGRRTASAPRAGAPSTASHSLSQARSVTP